MKTLLLSFCSLFIFVFTGSSQKNDYLWMMGYICSSTAPPPPQFWLCGLNNVDFNANPVSVYREWRPLSIWEGGGNANDKYGNLQFYSNGFEIRNRNDQLMPNGDSINYGQVWDNSHSLGTAYPSFHGMMIVPKPFSDSIYYAFTAAWEYGTEWSAYCHYLYYHVVDMNRQLGLGEVVDKNHVLISDTLVGGSGMAACKHANGRDWWIIMQKSYSNCFYKFLLTPQGLDTMGFQCIGDSLHFTSNRGSNVFSPDGSKYIWSSPYEETNILDFDRCTGEFSNYMHLPVVDSMLLVNGGNPFMADGYLQGVSVSPNSRYLYLSTYSELRQFDLQAADIMQSEVIVANTLTYSPLSSITFSRLAPDGKIYFTPLGQDTFLHVVNNPDQPGMACGFVKNGMELPSYNIRYVPHYPNYRLGRLIGSACDTVDYSSTVDVAVKKRILSVLPNPASNYVVVDYGFLDWSEGREAELQIHNSMGQLVYSQRLPHYSGFQKLDVSGYAKGLYLINLYQNGQKVEEVKLVKE